MFNEIHDIMMTFLWFGLCSVGPLICADLSYTHRSCQQPWALNTYERYQGTITIVTGDIITYTHTHIYTILYRNLQKVRSKTAENVYIHVCRRLVIVVYSEGDNKLHTLPTLLPHTQTDEQEARNVCTQP